MNNKKIIKSLCAIIAIAALFLIASYFVQKNIDSFENLLQNSLAGIFVYIFVMILETVLAPLTVLPLISIASNIWGPILAVLLTLFGWASGSLIAFAIGRKYGYPLVKEIISLEKLAKIEKLIPEKNILLGIIILRIMIPVDILSYVLGIFTRINWKTYTLGTLIGIIPGAFLLAYFGNIPFIYQLIVALSAGDFIFLFLIVKILRRKDNSHLFDRIWNKLFKS